MKKILFFLPNLLGGGAEKVLVSLVNNLNRDKYKITVMTLFDVGENKKEIAEDIEYKYIFKNIVHGNVFLFKFFSDRFLCRMMIHDEYDILISFLQSPTTRILSGYSGQGKIVNWIHNEYNDDKRLLVNFRSRQECINCFNKYAETVFVSSTAMDSFRSVFPDVNSHQRVLYNVVEDNKIREKALEVTDEIKKENGVFNLISVGRFVEQKAFDRLFRIIKRLEIEDGINTRLYLLGKGPLLKSYKEIISKLAIDEKVIFLGYRDNPYKFVKNADLFVCSSLYEGFSTAVTESLIVGTPVITTRCSGMEELIGKDNKYGIIVDNDEEALYIGLRNLLLSKEELKIMKNYAGMRGQSFSMENNLRKIEEFFDML